MRILLFTFNIMVTAAACAIRLTKALMVRPNYPVVPCRHYLLLLQSSTNSCTGSRLYSNKISTTTFDDDDDAANEKYVKSYQLDGIGRKSRVDINTNTGHHLITDVPKKMGGSDSAPQPVETLLAAWMGCTQATAIFVGRQMLPKRILIEKIEFHNIEAFRDERGALELPIDNIPSVPSRIQRITGTIKVFPRINNNKNKQQQSLFLTDTEIDLLKEQTEIRCPVANMIIASGCSIEVEWIDGTKDK